MAQLMPVNAEITEAHVSQRVAQLLGKVELFTGLTDHDLTQIAATCQAVRAGAGTVIFREGDEGDALYIIYEGSVRVTLATRKENGTSGPATINVLYAGQCVGELVLLNGATRSATVIAAEATTLILIRESAFRTLCDTNPRIGYVVMRNMAEDLANKLRASTLLLRGNIRLE